MNKYKPLIILILTMSLISVFACAGYQKIKRDEAFLRIKPDAPLPEAMVKKQPVNLLIEVNNVADLRGSYKNYLELFVNKFLIEPDEVSNIKSDYTYQLSLQPGIYKVKALYYASTGWQEKAFKIIPRDGQVMVFPDRRAVLKVTLKKDSWGAPVDKITYFDVYYEPIERQ